MPRSCSRWYVHHQVCTSLTIYILLHMIFAASGTRPPSVTDWTACPIYIEPAASDGNIQSLMLLFNIFIAETYIMWHLHRYACALGHTNGRFHSTAMDGDLPVGTNHTLSNLPVLASWPVSCVTFLCASSVLCRVLHVVYCAVRLALQKAERVALSSAAPALTRGRRFGAVALDTV